MPTTSTKSPPKYWDHYFIQGWKQGIAHANKRLMLGHNPEHLSEECLEKALKELI